MPITKSAKKALRVSKRKQIFNLKRKDSVRSAIKNVKKAAGKSKDEALKALSLAYKHLDKAAKKGVLKKNAASRKKSRLAALVKKSISK